MARELRRAIVARHPAQLPGLASVLAGAGAVRPLPRGLGERVGREVGAAQRHQQCLGALAQRVHVDARRHREQDVAQAQAFPGTVAFPVGGVVTAASLFRRFGDGDLAIDQLLDRRSGGGADRSVGGGDVADRQQPRPLRGLAQQLGAGALAQAPQRRAPRPRRAAARR